MRKIDLLNFFYGLGAAIILIAALFKFLGWKGSDLLFVVGLIGEALIFLISGAQPIVKNKAYQWERVFPQLGSEGQVNGFKPTKESAQATQEQQVQHIIQSIVELNGSVDSLNAATQRLTNYVEKLETNYEMVNNSTLDYHKEINNLKAKIASANEQLKAFDQFDIKP